MSEACAGPSAPDQDGYHFVTHLSNEDEAFGFARIVATMRNVVDRQEAFHRLTDVLRCKWTIAILDAIAEGRNRPSALERALDGLTAKVLNDRLSKLLRYGLIEKRSFDEIPPRTEYHLSARGQQLVRMLAGLREFAEGWVQGGAPSPSTRETD